MRASNFKNLLNKHKMVLSEKFHVECEHLIYLQVKLYTLGIEVNSLLIPLANAFLELQLKKPPQSVIQSKEGLLDGFNAFLAEKNSQKQLDYFIEEDDKYAKQLLAPALQAKLQSFKLLETKPTDEQNFYKELFNEIDKNAKWVEDIAVEVEMNFYTNTVQIMIKLIGRIVRYYAILEDLEFETLPSLN
ncbi:hypothetical protein LSTR_LSTR016002 [Laodelphax striatellus]|nr:hypothetical protein LSTR_LSTR016002 [Laodelphax striatellus]